MICHRQQWLTLTMFLAPSKSSLTFECIRHCILQIPLSLIINFQRLIYFYLQLTFFSAIFLVDLYSIRIIIK